MLTSLSVGSKSAVISIFLYKLLLDALGGNNTILDSASTMISIIANTLMLLRYREQWLLWIIIDMICIKPKGITR